VDKVDASTKVMTTMMTARMSSTKKRDRNLIPPGDTAQRNVTNNFGFGALDNDNLEYNNARRGDRGPVSAINDGDN
jgi:hypothetical protein